MNNPILFTKIKIGKLELKNRFVMPAMNSHMTENNCYFENGVAYYTERIKGGFGLVITEFMAVDRNGLGSLREPGLWSDAFLPTLTKLTQSVHNERGYIFAQLHHAGMNSKSFELNEAAKGPSEIVSFNDDKVIQALGKEEIYKIIDKFILGAERAQKAGFDGVEIHGAHGYLITQFLSRKTNRRIDEFGGSYENRFRIAKLIIEGIKEKCGKDFPISFRINAIDGGDPEDNKLIDNCIYAKLAEVSGADCLNVSIGNSIGTYFDDPGFNALNSREMKKHVKIPVITVGRINDEYVAEKMVAAGDSDLIALGRQSICDPHFPEKVKNGHPELIFRCLGCLQRCSPDIGCEEEDSGISCMINPFSGKEARWHIKLTNKKKNIAIIGAGCAGLQAAWILGARGHTVTVYDSRANIGGLLIPASVPEKKYGLLQTISTYYQYCLNYGVKFEMNKEVNEENINNLYADCYIVATGSKPFIPQIKGLNNNYVTAEDVLRINTVIRDKKVAILGGGTVGLETAEYLSGYNNEIDVIEMKDNVAVDMNPLIRSTLMEKLNNKTKFNTNAKIIEITLNKEILIETGNGTNLSKQYDVIVVALGYRNNEKFSSLIVDKEYYVIGDASKARTAKMAIYEATKLAIKI